MVNKDLSQTWLQSACEESPRLFPRTVYVDRSGWVHSDELAAKHRVDVWIIGPTVENYF